MSLLDYRNKYVSARIASGPGIDPTGVTDSTAGLQAALDDAIGRGLFIPPGMYRLASTLMINSNQVIFGLSNGAAEGNGQPTVLMYYGADGTHALQTKTGGRSRITIERLRIEDRRTTPTPGCGIFLELAANVVELRHLTVFSFPDDAISIGGQQVGETADCVTIEEIWCSGGRYGINLERVDNLAVLSDIKGDNRLTSPVQMDALINVDHMAYGTCAVVLDGAKLETNNGCHLLRIGSTFNAMISATGLAMRGPTAGLGGDVVHIESTDAHCCVTLSAIGTVDLGGAAVAVNLVNDVGLGLTYTGNQMPWWVRESNKVTHYIGGAFKVDGQAVHPILKRWIPASDIEISSGAPTKTQVGGAYFMWWVLDQTTQEAILAVVDGEWFADAGWSTFNVHALGANQASGSGAIVLQLQTTIWAVGSTKATAINQTAVTITAAALEVLQTTQVGTGITAPSATQMIGLRLTRVAADAGDTLANDYGIFGLRLTKAS